jgi:hypothetical protein
VFSLHANLGRRFVFTVRHVLVTPLNDLTATIIHD